MSVEIAESGELTGVPCITPASGHLSCSYRSPAALVLSEVDGQDFWRLIGSVKLDTANMTVHVICRDLPR
jgi:hypothetical protein